MFDLATTLTAECWAAVGGTVQAAEHVTFARSGGLPSAFAVTDIASAAIATAGLAIADLLHDLTGTFPPVTVDRRLCSLWFAASLRPLDWQPASPWDPLAGDYRTCDGWIRLHTNAPPHRAAVEQVLGSPGDRLAVARAVAAWPKTALERAVLEAGGCAAEMRSLVAWADHPQGQAVACEPLIHAVATHPTSTAPWRFDAVRPLLGLRVLDLTRVVAGPVASRWLAGFGAHVLRIDPPEWDEPAVVPEVTLGKRCARLDLRLPAQRDVFEHLLSNADVLIHGYRPGALEQLGYGADRRHSLCPGLIDVSLDAYGWTGPWAGRRGFDSLVQMSTGIAAYGMQRTRAEQPVPLPVQALDHATGYLMAAAAIRGVTRRLRDGRGLHAHLSLARTAQLVIDHPRDLRERALAPDEPADRAPGIETTAWGTAQRVHPPLRIAGVALRWETPARPLGSDRPAWW